MPATIIAGSGASCRAPCIFFSSLSGVAQHQLSAAFVSRHPPWRNPNGHHFGNRRCWIPTHSRHPDAPQRSRSPRGRPRWGWLGVFPGEPIVQHVPGSNACLRSNPIPAIPNAPNARSHEAPVSGAPHEHSSSTRAFAATAKTDSTTHVAPGVDPVLAKKSRLPRCLVRARSPTEVLAGRSARAEFPFHCGRPPRFGPCTARFGDRGRSAPKTHNTSFGSNPGHQFAVNNFSALNPPWPAAKRRRWPSAQPAGHVPHMVELRRVRPPRRTEPIRIRGSACSQPADMRPDGRPAENHQVTLPPSSTISRPGSLSIPAGHCRWVGETRRRPGTTVDRRVV